MCGYGHISRYRKRRFDRRRWRAGEVPEEAIAFLQDYDAARGVALTRRQQRAAAGATACIPAFNARSEVGMPAGEGATTAPVRERQPDFLDLSW